MNYKVGGLTSFTTEDYPGLGAYFVQIWSYGTGPDRQNEVVARVYGNTPEEARQKAEQFVSAMTYIQSGEADFTLAHMREHQKGRTL